MKRILLCSIAALATAGCGTISTELDPAGSPKYRAGLKATGTNFARRADAKDMPNTKALGGDDIDRLLRTGGNGKPPGTL